MSGLYKLEYDFIDQAYDPDVTEYQHTQATEEALLERIQLRRVAHAMEVYIAMKRLGRPQLFLQY